MKWEKAVVHLEGHSNRQDMRDFDEFQKKMLQKREDSTITDTEYINNILAFQLKEDRSHGTAVLIEDKDELYLLSAHHVFFDKTTARFQLKEKYDEAMKIKDFRKRLGTIAILDSQLDQNLMYSTIVRVPGFNDNRKNFMLIWGLNESGSQTKHFTCSYKNDLIIVSLKVGILKNFGEDLISMGYLPISIKDIDSSSIQVGDKLITVGFPRSTAIIETKRMDMLDLMFTSNKISLPIFAFGNVAMSNINLPYFWGDLSVYPGNSGGPVIKKENAKMVGLVTKQALTPIYNHTGNYLPLSSRIPYAKIIKSSEIIKLFNEHKKRESKW